MRLTIKRGDLEIEVTGRYDEDFETNAAEFEIEKTDPPDVELTDTEYDELLQRAAEYVWDDDGKD